MRDTGDGKRCGGQPGAEGARACLHHNTNLNKGRVHKSRPPARPPAGAVGERLPASADRDLYKGESQEQEATEEGMKGDEMRR